MELDKGYVRILEGQRSSYGLQDEGRLLVAIHLDKGQACERLRNQSPKGKPGRKTRK
jgi:hypothetical protein